MRSPTGGGARELKLLALHLRVDRFAENFGVGGPRHSRSSPAHPAALTGRRPRRSRIRSQRRLEPPYSPATWPKKRRAERAVARACAPFRRLACAGARAATVGEIETSEASISRERL